MSRHVACPLSSSVFRSFCWVAAAVILHGTAADGSAATRAERQQQAAQLVREALAHESLGLAEEREDLLASAAQLAPDYAPAQWHRGRVRMGNQWFAVDENLETDNQRRLRETYEQQRAKAADTAADQLALADWCAARRLSPQATAHLNRVIQLEPGHVAARQRLNQRQLGGRWVADQNLWAGLQDRRRVQAAVDKWRVSLLRLAAATADRDSARQAALREKLRAELDAEAIPAIETVLAMHSEPAARLAVDILHSMPGHASSLALARIGVLSPWREVRDGATTRLTTRPHDHYVPLLLSELSTPIDTRLESALVNGQLLFRHEFVQEFQDRKEMVVLDTALQRRPSLVRTTAAGGLLPDSQGASAAIQTAETQTRARALADMQRTLVARELLRQQRNLWVLEMNERIGLVLKVSTEQNLPPAPEAWWSWWDEENDVLLDGEKFTNVRYEQDVRVYDDIVQPISRGDSLLGSRPAGRRCECFVAGTPVWTIAGAVPIEQVQVGDLVLSQDPESGELAYRPVLQTTIRPPEPLFKVTLATREREVLEGSGGHPLWVAGDGWMLLRKLQSGTILHGVEGSAVVSDIAEGGVAETHNLVVDGFHTYVVGEAKIVCHDNTPRRPTDAIVPGLIPQ